MIDLKAPESARRTGPSIKSLFGQDQYVANRARLTAIDGLSLHYRTWVPNDAPSAVVLFAHGIASHSAWFAGTAVHLASRGIAVYAPDRRGSGLSGGPRGHIASYEQVVDDLDLFFDRVASQHPGVPIFLAGSSWSAKVAIVSAARSEQRLAGLILLGPGLFPQIDLTLQRKLAVLAYHRFQPEHELHIPLTSDHYTRNPEFLEYIRRDGYRLLTATSRFFWETRRLDVARDDIAHSLTLPMLLQIGDADPIVDTEATSRWFRGLSAPDRTLLVYRDAAHTLDFESEPTVLSYRTDLLGWLRRQLAQEDDDVR